MVRLTLAAFFIVSILLAGCSREAERDFARIRTLDATQVNASGAVLNGLISNYNDHPVTECGFLIFRKENSSESYLGTLSAVADEDGRFSARIMLGVLKDVKYYYLGYAVSDGIISYGNMASYTGMGGAKPEALGYQGTDAVFLDTIMIRFNGNLGGLDGFEVSFDDHPAKVVDFKNEYLRVIVPAALDTRESTISVRFVYSVSSPSGQFVLPAPDINSLSRYKAYPGDTMTISGINFHPIPAYNVVKFNDLQAEVISSSRTKLLVRVPFSATDDNAITVTIAGQTASVPQMFKIPTPSITSFSKSEAFPGEVISIYGSDFHPVRSNNTVMFNSNAAFIMLATENRIDVLVPELEGRDCQVSVTIAGKTGQASALYKVLLRPVVWQKMNNFAGGYLYKMSTFVIDDFGYIGGGTATSSWFNLKFWRYNPDGDQYTEVTPFPGPVRIEPRSFSIDGIGYFGGGFDRDNSSRLPLKDFYKYDPQSDTWTPIGPYPGDVSNVFHGITEKVGAKAYLSFTPTDFYSFEPSTGKWAKLPVPSTGLYSHSGSFVIGNIIYIVCGRTTGGSYVKDLWAFDVTTSTWSGKADYPGQARMGGNGFTIGGYGFYGLGIAGATSPLFKDMWMYDPSADAWTIKLGDFPGNARTSAFSMVINGKAYIGCGYAGNSNLTNDVYRFNPEFLK